VVSGFDLLDCSSSAEIRVSIMVMAAPEVSPWCNS
jgi:hypothetical protein